MKALSFFVAFSFTIFCSCKKSSSPGIPANINKTLSYKFVATIPSASDSARGIFSDSLYLNTETTIGDATHLNNFTGVSTDMTPSYFSITHDNEGVSLPYFYFSNSIFQGVPSQPELNKVYVSDNDYGLYPPIKLGHTQSSGQKIYYLEPGEDFDTSALYTSLNHTEIKFTRIDTYKMPGETIPFRIVDGDFIGYRTTSHRVSPNKVIRRIDFAVTFSGLVVDRRQ